MTEIVVRTRHKSITLGSRFETQYQPKEYDPYMRGFQASGKPLTLHLHATNFRSVLKFIGSGRLRTLVTDATS